MKRKLLLSILAMIPAAFLPLAATSQIAPDYETPSAAQAEPSMKYEVFAGYGYTSLNQVNESRHGLQGVNLSVTRDLSKHFGITADGAYYPSAVGSGNPGDPKVTVLLFGPVVRAHLLGRYSLFAHVRGTHRWRSRWHPQGFVRGEPRYRHGLPTQAAVFPASVGRRCDLVVHRGS